MWFSSSLQFTLLPTDLCHSLKRGNDKNKRIIFKNLRGQSDTSLCPVQQQSVATLWDRGNVSRCGCFRSRPSYGPGTIRGREEAGQNVAIREDTTETKEQREGGRSPAVCELTVEYELDTLSCSQGVELGESKQMAL